MNRAKQILGLLIILVVAGCNLPLGGVENEASSTPAPPVQATSNGNSIPVTTDTAPAAETTSTSTQSQTATLNPDWIQHLPPDALIDVTYVRMLDGNTGWAVGGLKDAPDHNHILRTSDGGATWTDVTPPEKARGRGEAVAFFADAAKAWVTFHEPGLNSVPDAPVVWRTTDAGRSWTPSTPLDTTDLQVYSVSDVFFTGDNGWMLVHAGAGMNHDYIALYHSTDRGASWTRRIDPQSDGGIQSCLKTGLLFQDEMHGWLTGDCGGVVIGAWLYRTADGGRTWEPIALPAPESETDLFTAVDSVCGIRPPSAFSSTLYLPVECMDYSGPTPLRKNFLYSSSDRGAHWSNAPYPGGAFAPYDSETGWALGLVIYRTVNGGRDWQLQSTVTWDGQFSFISSTHGFAVAQKDGGFGLVATANGGAAWALLSPVIASES